MTYLSTFFDTIYYDLANSDSERKSAFNKKKIYIDREFESRCKKRKELLDFDIEPID